MDGKRNVSVFSSFTIVALPVTLQPRVLSPVGRASKILLFLPLNYPRRTDQNSLSSGSYISVFPMHFRLRAGWLARWWPTEIPGHGRSENWLSAILDTIGDPCRKYAEKGNAGCTSRNRRSMLLNVFPGENERELSRGTPSIDIRTSEIAVLNFLEWIQISQRNRFTTYRLTGKRILIEKRTR